MLPVWTGNENVGVLDRSTTEKFGYAFSYHAAENPDQAVSLTMPVATESYVQELGLHPIFQMNMPEGRLREAIDRRFRKVTPNFDDLSLLEITGPSQIGRLRYGETLNKAPFQEQSVSEILSYSGSEDLFLDLLDRFAAQSGVSGVQPKVLVRDESNVSGDGRKSLTFKGATHLVKSWDKDEFPELAANEYFCLQVAKAAGLSTPEVALSDNARFLVVTRFDLEADGNYLGFEDLCVLNGLPTQEKYSLSYERVAKSLKIFVSPESRIASLEQFFTSLLVNCAVQNGDAHLKNFGVLYRTTEQPVVIAPVYDVVTTTPYIAKDVMALTLDGRKSYPSAKVLTRFAQTVCGIEPRAAAMLIEKVADAIHTVMPHVTQYIKDRPEFKEVGTAMMSAWGAGVKKSLLQETLRKPVPRENDFGI